MQPNPLRPEEQVYAIKTWRYLRLAMVVLVVGLAAAIGFERWKVHPGCFQTSISAYYYTPVHAFFVGGLVAIGTCLFCLKGNTEIEDTLLNLAGIFAPFVAFVPTPSPGSCASVLEATKDHKMNIANNVFALLTVLLIALLILAALTARNLPPAPAMIGYACAATVWLVAALVFGLARGFFEKNAHYTAAILMFVCILGVVVTNAFGYKQKTGATSYRNRYAAIAAAMVVAVIVIGLAGALGWDHWVLVIEATLITLFAVFWATQTKELWHDGLR